MRHVALILLTSSFFTACITEADRALWTETKETLSSGKFASLEPSEAASIAESDKDEELEDKPAQATTGR